MQILTVSRLTAYIKQKLESDMNLSNVWVRGEVSNFKHHSSGHMYFTLKDKTTALRCIMFKSRNQHLEFRPVEGMGVIARGYVTLYERDGQYQLYVDELQPDGVGALYTAFLQLKEKLEREGLFDKGRKRPLPGFPRRVGVITSPTGAAVRDIINVMTRRFPLAHIILIPVAVQGDTAPPQIAEGIRQANMAGDIDVLIVGRGGGSIEELWAFNTEVVARSIFTSSIPVVSAVGHETDFTIADFVADLRAPTPSAAAELVVPDLKELLKHLGVLEQRLVTGIRGMHGRLREKVSRAAASPYLTRPKDDLYRKMQEVDEQVRRLGQGLKAGITAKRNNLALEVARLDSLSPLGTLGRGYAICRDDQGRVIRQVNKVSIGEKLEIILTDGTLDCGVLGVKEGYHGQKKE